MGFDNECILNIQSLAGEYFCPVCRLLVYPDETLQSQCTHLYCKPCLSYVVSTTRACPYDGYLVTQADSKPLVESNKTLAETIGKIPVHCLYHRSGCTWQGTLSDCTSHCSGCAFGNSPVVCNRCGIQIVHRQVQEHAQNCPGVQGQVQQGTVTQDPSATSTIASTASADQNQTPAGAMASQALNSQTAVTTTTTGQVSNQLPNPASQSQPVQTAVQPTAEQWYQQQQYQQYYQQYPGQDPYQQQYQHYYPYQQSVVPPYQQAYGQPQPQSQSQPQVQPQSQGQPQAQHQAQPQLQPQPQAQGLSQTLPQVHAPMAPQSQAQMQVHQQQQQQLQPAAQPHSQIQPPSHPPGHTQTLPKSQPQPSPYPYPQVPHAVQPQTQQHIQMPPYQQPHPQMQHSQPQIQQPVQKYPVPHPQVHPQLQANAPVQHPSQPQVHPNQPLAANVQPQVQNASSHAVMGYHSYPQPHQGIQPGAPQHAMQMHAQSGPLPQAQHPVPMQNQFPQQISMMHPHQSPTTFPNQQQPALFPPPVQGQSTPPLQQQPVYNSNQQTGQMNQHPILQPAQQILPQQPSAQHQIPLPSHLRPQGPAHSFPRHAFPPSQGNPALPSSTQHSQSQNAGGRPIIPNHAAQIQPFAQSGNNVPVRPGQTGAGHLPENQNLLVGTNNQVQLSSGFQSRVLEQIERQGDAIEQQTDSASGKLEPKYEKVETDIKPTEVGNKQSGEDPNPVKTSGPNANALKNGDSVSKSVGKGEVAESTREASNGNRSRDTITGVQNNSNEHSAPESSEIKDGSVLKTEAKNVSESETDKLRNDDTPTTRPPCADNQAPAASQTHGSQGPVGFAQPSHLAPLTDHGKHHQPMANYGPGGALQRSSAMLGSQLSHPAGPNDPLSSGHSSTLARNHGPAHDSYLGQPHGSDIQFGTPGKSIPPQSLGPPGPYNRGQEPPFHAGASNLSRIGGPQFGAPRPGDMHGGMATNLPPHGPDGFGLQDERFNSFQVAGQQNFVRREFEGDLKKFSRPPLDAELVSKFGNYPLGPLEAGKRPVGFHDDAVKKSGATLHPGYLGVGSGYGRHHVDGMAPRSPGSEYVEMPPHRLGPLTGGLVSKAGMDDFDGRAAHRFGESAFHDRRFPHPPGHLHRDEFEGFGSFRMGEHPRSGDFVGQDEFSDHFHRGEHFGPHNFSRRLPLREPIGFGAHPGHMRAVELSGSRSFDSFESFSKGDRPGHPQLGEPGFRSSFSLPGFPNDPGFLPGDIRSFDNLRRRKVTSMGWCRICRVDCETVEGLDLHSQTREHQKMAMDMVKSIKQNVKKQKLIRAEHSSVEDGNKSRKTGFEGRGNKH